MPVRMNENGQANAPATTAKETQTLNLLPAASGRESLRRVAERQQFAPDEG